MDQQASTFNDSLILSILVKIDDNPVVSYVTVPIAQQIYSGSTVDLGRWAETPPIEVNDVSLITVNYHVLNITGGWTDQFTTLANELTQNILPPLQGIASLADIPLSAYVNAVVGALEFIYNSQEIPDCSGLVHVHSDQYTGTRLRELTANYATHRIANTPSMQLQPPGSGCNTPASRLSLAVEMVPPQISAAGPAKSSDRSIVIAETLPLGATTAYAFSPADPMKFVAPANTFTGVVAGKISVVAQPGGQDVAVTPMHLLARGLDPATIQHAVHDGAGWHGWTKLSDQAFADIAARASDSEIDVIGLDESGNLLHGTLTAAGALSSFTGGTPNPNPPLDFSVGFETNPYDLYQWNPKTRIAAVWGHGVGYQIFAGLPPVGIESYWGTRVAGGLVLEANLQLPGTWSVNWPYDDAEFPSFMALGPDAVAPAIVSFPLANGSDKSSAVALFLIGHINALYSNYLDNPTLLGGGKPFLDSFNGQFPFPGAPQRAAEVTAAFNAKTGTLWFAYIGTDQLVYVGAYLPGTNTWLPLGASLLSQWFVN